ncbi:UNVERIFIED_CONTAM: hypothetical protein K2H54_041966 [Gekko kuhli]
MPDPAEVKLCLNTLAGKHGSASWKKETEEEGQFFLPQHRVAEENANQVIFERNKSIIPAAVQLGKNRLEETLIGSGCAREQNLAAFNCHEPIVQTVD